VTMDQGKHGPTRTATSALYFSAACRRGRGDVAVVPVWYHRDRVRRDKRAPSSALRSSGGAQDPHCRGSQLIPLACAQLGKHRHTERPVRRIGRPRPRPVTSIWGQVPGSRCFAVPPPLAQDRLDPLCTLPSSCSAAAAGLADNVTRSTADPSGATRPVAWADRLGPGQPTTPARCQRRRVMAFIGLDVARLGQRSVSERRSAVSSVC